MRRRLPLCSLALTLAGACLLSSVALGGCQGAKQTPAPTPTLAQATWTPAAQASQPLAVITPLASPTATRAMTATPAPTAAVAAAAPTAPPTLTAAPAPTWPSAPRGIIGRLVIPRLGRDLPIISVSWHIEEVSGQAVAVWDTVSGAVGHHRGTAPLGQIGNTILSGHTGGANGGVFNRLWELEPGDELRLIIPDGGERRYTVAQVLKLQEVGATLQQRLANAQYMASTADERLTLVTCWPEWAYTHRIVVIARPAE